MLDETERRKRVLLLHIDANFSDGELRLDFDLTFSPKSIRVGKINKVEYYVGSTGGHLNLKPQGGKITSHTPAKNISVQYLITDNTDKRSRIKAAPKLQITAKDEKLNAEIGGLEFETVASDQKQSEFSNTERLLETEFANPDLKWTLQLPRGKKITRDFLQGNLNLFAELKTTTGSLDGSVEIAPTDITFFGPDRAPLGALASLRMKYLLWRKGYLILDQAPEKISFSMSYEA